MRVTKPVLHSPARSAGEAPHALDEYSVDWQYTGTTHGDNTRG